MPGTGSQVLDVAIGMAFIFLIVSLLCATINEIVATILNRRAVFLERGLRRMLEDDDLADDARDVLDDVLKHPLIKDQVPQGEKWRKPKRVPSYLSPRLFALTLLDTLAPAAAGGGTKRDLVAEARESFATLPDGALKQKLGTLLDDADDDIQRFRHNLETWFDDTMNRVAGWYKRRSQIWVTAFAVIVVCAANVDAIHIANRLWKDESLRTPLVAQATQVAESGSLNEAKQEANKLEESNALELPIGWGQPDPPGVPLKALGLLLSVLGVFLGAPFWFDTLNRLARLRGTGDKPKAAEG